MDFLAHLVFGIWVSKRFNSFWGVILSTILDIDHPLGYMYDNWYKKLHFPKWQRIAYRPRSWFHSLTVLIFLTIFLSRFMNPKLVFISLASHLLMDVIDVNGIYIFPPLMKKRIRGPLPVSYLWENPEKPTHRKKAHLPSIMIIILFSLLLLLE